MIGELRCRIDTVLADLVARRCAELASTDEHLGVILEVARDFVLGGGKRLRPLFCYWGWRGAGRPDDEGILAVSAALEIVHAFALVHDDVMDGSDLRRGLPSVHRRLAELHRTSGWRGSPATFGVSVAILVGDLYAAWAQDVFSNSGVDTAAVVRARPLFDRLHSEVIAGQYLDLVGQASGEASLDFARRMALNKSGRYSVERPLQIGGALAGADPGLLARYSSYGQAVGEAFQLRDDILGVFGDPDDTGKPNLDDVRTGKPTILAALARALGSPAQRDVLAAHYGHPGADPSAVDAVRAVFVDSGALEAAERRIEELRRHALVALTGRCLPPEAADALAELALLATQRAR